MIELFSSSNQQQFSGLSEQAMVGIADRGGDDVVPSVQITPVEPRCAWASQPVELDFTGPPGLSTVTFEPEVPVIGHRLNGDADT